MIASALRIFVLGDTHNKLPKQLRAPAEAVDEIWHLGDVCSPSILDEIRTWGAPVRVVLGNCDDNLEWPAVLHLTRNTVRFQLVHIPPTRPPAGVDVVLHGHTHVTRDEMVGGVRFLNPGCVTRPNRGAPPSVALLEVDEQGAIEWRLLPVR